MKMESHIPVLLNEVIDGLILKNSAHLHRRLKIIDATLGLAGHTIEFVKLGSDVLGIDADTKSLELAENKLSKACPSPDGSYVGRYKLIHGNFRNIDVIAKDNDFDQVDGVLLDLGISSFQLSHSQKGLTFIDSKEPLDMRLDPVSQSVTAANLLNILSKDQLIDLFSATMDRKDAKRLSDRVIGLRDFKSIAVVGDLLDILGRQKYLRKGLHPATLPMLALRIAVNSELDNLQDTLPKAFSLLTYSGRLAVISFHSGEDSIVNRYFDALDEGGLGKILTPKPITPSPFEIKTNPRARSAKLRIIQKI